MIVKTRMERADLVLPILSILIIFISLGVILAMIAGNSTPPAILFCPIGSCSTSIRNGTKICPLTGEQSEVNAASQVCNPRDFCTNPLTPWALGSDGGTALSGTYSNTRETNIDICPDNSSGCGCAGTRQCPTYIASVFEARTSFTDITHRWFNQVLPESLFLAVEGATDQIGRPIKLAANQVCAVPVGSRITVSGSLQPLTGPIFCLSGTPAHLENGSFACVMPRDGVIPTCTGGTLPVLRQIDETLQCE